ncbi:MAG: LpqB family beta-propeller domain-containing protein [Nocardioides sp.]
MTATPLQTRTAQEFLSAQGRQQWKPQRVLTYRTRSVSGGSGDLAGVTVKLHGTDQVGVGGQWRGGSPVDGRTLDFRMVRENGEWRIARAPDALIVPRTYFDQQYQESEVYFFDPSGRILVPEQVHVQQGAQLASALVRALVRGPGHSLTGVVRSFLPAGLTPVPVPVSDSGSADVTLRGPTVGPLSRRTTQLIVAQLSWTLQQDPSITSFRLNIAGRAVTGPSGSQVFRLDSDANDPHDPAVSQASSLFFALRRGRLVSGPISQPTKVEGPFGTEGLGIGSYAVSLDGDQVAGVAGTRLLLGPVGLTATPTAAVQVMSGGGMLRPSWDFAGRLWEVQETSSGARVYVVGRHHADRIRVPGISGEPVRRFLVSRDGSRLVAVIRRPGGDRIVVSRLRYGADGDPVRGTAARRIPWVSSGTTRIRDIGWTSPTTIEVLDQVSRTQAEARILNVDGSTSADEAPISAIPGRALGLVTSPVASQTPYAALPRSLYDLAQVDTTPPSLANVSTPRLRHVAYAG